MDSTVFIRSRRVLAMWLIIPMFAVAVAYLGSRTFCSYQQVSYLRKQSLSRFIPEMIAEGEKFERFIKEYEINTTGSSSVEDTCIELLNTAAGEANFKITSINLVQIRDQTPGAIKVAVTVNGHGSCRNIAVFLQNIKKQDPLIYEELIDLTRTGDGSDLLQAEALLGRVYIENEGVLL